jgi:hypothetical protein
MPEGKHMRATSSRAYDFGLNLALHKVGAGRFVWGYA